VGLEVDALARGVGRDEDADGVLVRRGVEGALHLVARVVAHAAVEDEDALVAAIGVGDGAAQELEEVALGVAPLGEEDDAAIGPAGAGGIGGLIEADRWALMLAHPGQ